MTNSKFIRTNAASGKRGEWPWRRTASNGQIVGAASEGYKSRKDAEANMNRGPNPKDKWDIYQDKRGEWRWRRRAVNGNIVNGNIIGAASEGYKSKGDAVANAERQGYSA
jgi:uncharacterized protein YegP (UPF0339 family)